MKSIRAIYNKIYKPSHPRPDWPTDIERKESNQLIFDLLKSENPCYIGRVGTVEGAIVHNYLSIKSNKCYLLKLVDFVKGEQRLPWWDTSRPVDELMNNAGFFTSNNRPTIKELEDFSKLYVEGIGNMDICGHFEYYERFLPFSKGCKMVQLETLYPFFVDNAWSRVLKGKRVLVIHPFVDTIKRQYEKRKKLFVNPDILPEYELISLKAVQSIGGSNNEFQDWFEALEYMKKQIYETDFDIAIIGCGAYGLPLSSFVKNIGKKAIHIGGGTQLLFGIKGKRWEEQYTNTCYKDMFNEFWVYPSNEEKPSSASKVENGCYW